MKKLTKKEELLKAVRRKSFDNIDDDSPEPDSVTALMDRALWALEHPKQYTSVYIKNLEESCYNIIDCVSRVLGTIPEITKNVKRK